MPPPAQPAGLLCVRGNSASVIWTIFAAGVPCLSDRCAAGRWAPRGALRRAAGVLIADGRKATGKQGGAPSPWGLGEPAAAPGPHAAAAPRLQPRGGDGGQWGPAWQPGGSPGSGRAAGWRGAAAAREVGTRVLPAADSLPHAAYDSTGKVWQVDAAGLARSRSVVKPARRCGHASRIPPPTGFPRLLRLCS